LDLAGFLGGLTHHMASPLNALAMNAELAKVLLDHGKIIQAIEALDRVAGECERCGKLLHDLQRFGTCLQTSPCEPIALQELLDAGHMLMCQQFEGSAPQLHATGANPILYVPKEAAESSFAAIFKNAAEAGAGQILIDVTSAAESVRIDISDDGSGIRDASLPRVTEAFFSTRRDQGHSGLGLALVQQFVQHQGGTLQIGRAASGGARLVVILPVARAEALS
jgi:signal transduction histidine kinase